MHYHKVKICHIPTIYPNHEAIFLLTARKFNFSNKHWSDSIILSRKRRRKNFPLSQLLHSVMIPVEKHIEIDF